MIIKSLLDTDLYKLTMQQAVITQFPKEIVRYELILRTKSDFPLHFAEQLKEHIHCMNSIPLQSSELDFLSKNCYYFKPPYFDFLRGYRFDPYEVTVNQNGTTLSLKIEGYWYRTILWEVPLMALISELYFNLTNQKTIPVESITQKNKEKIERLERIRAVFSDFGTRRRFSFENHDQIISACKQYAPNSFYGTSNLLLAMKHNCKPIGTQAHEWYMTIAAMYGYKQANKIGMERWVDEYQGDLGIALTDTYTSGLFFQNFETKYAKLFDGIRHDSGDPFSFAEKAIAHYRKLRINPMSKFIVFSDNIDADKVERIESFCRGKIRTSYGIGTNLTNDVGVTPLNMVIKLTHIFSGNKWIPTVKLTDDPGKQIGDVQAIQLCKQIIDL